MNKCSELCAPREMDIRQLNRLVPEKSARGVLLQRSWIAEMVFLNPVARSTRIDCWEGGREEQLHRTLLSFGLSSNSKSNWVR